LTFDKYRVRICVVFNPAARGEKAKRFRRHLDDFGAECALKPTTAPGGARVLAAEAVREGFDIVVAAGGDGTVNEVLNGIGDEPDGFSRTRLGVLPLGTINVFARELGLPLNVNRAWAAIRRGRVMAIDLPQVEFTADGEPRRRYFAQLAGAGLDARAVELVNWNLKKKIGFFAYVVAALKALCGAQSQIATEGVLQSVTGEQVLIGNGRLYGGSFAVFPEAKLTDGLLDVCVFPRVTTGTVIACAYGLIAGRLHRSGGARHFQAESFSLTSPSRTPFELDGEIVGELPARFSVQHRMLRVIVPGL
jgi:YegS/Rv2252/BmrU family lipid kinase